MSLSRLERSRSAIPVWRWVWLAVLFAALVFLSFALYVRSAEADYRAGETKAIQLAKQTAGLKKTEDAVKHVWDDTVWVVIGKDADGNEMFVWELPDGSVVKEMAADGLTEAAMAARFREQSGGKRILRMLPGWFQGQPVWEIRYESDPKTDRQAIDFYAFKDGTKLKTYDLPGK